MTMALLDAATRVLLVALVLVAAAAIVSGLRGERS